MDKIVELKINNNDDKNIKVLIDKSDYKWAKKYNWYLTGENKKYISRTYKKQKFYLHREILGLQKGDGLYSDHRDRNTFNNCRSNLRVVTARQNQYNTNRRNKTGFTGVCENGIYYVSKIYFNKKPFYIGTFKNLIDAVIARDTAVNLTRGEYGYYLLPKKVSDYFAKKVINKIISKKILDFPKNLSYILYENNNKGEDNE